MNTEEMNTEEYEKVNDLGRETVKVLSNGVMATLAVWRESYGPTIALHLARYVAVGVFYTLAEDSEDFEEVLREYLAEFERCVRGFSDPTCNDATEYNKRLAKSRRAKMA